MHLDLQLTPGQPHFRTYNPRADTGAIPECRAVMIRNRPDTKPAPATMVGGRRVKSRPPQKEAQPSLSVPLPSETNTEDSDWGDVRMIRAVNFVQFCKHPNVKAMRVTWEELDRAELMSQERSNSPGSAKVPDVSDNDFRNILSGHVTTATYSQFPRRYHDFLNECSRAMHLSALSGADIDKFMASKPEMGKDELRKKLPE